MNKIINFFTLLWLSSVTFGQTVTVKPYEVTYGRKDGMALTMVVQQPNEPSNGRGIIWVVSAGWTSNYNWVIMFNGLTKPISDKGYTMFFVMHGSQPKYTVSDAVADLKRAVRFIRYHATDYGIDPCQIGISGASAGGHLSMMIGTTGDDGDPNAKDPVDRVSSRVQAVACFFPPVDLLNWKAEGDNAVIHSEMKEFTGPS